ncbi:MAG: hypothetical protein J7K51_10445 [Thermotogae bacterium]|nr:hypothetical protein [Thermotogota bacterium]
MKQGYNLSFTGNWFIDAGVLGFVNLMEEVYGWDLEELNKKIKKKPEEIYYWYFPIGYILYNNKLRGKVIKSVPVPSGNFKNAMDIFEKAWKRILNEKQFIVSKGEKKRIDLSFKKPFNYFTNFLFFQPKWDANKQKESFLEILRLKDVENGVLKHIDKTINKFLPSMGEFSNIPYSKSLITLKTILNFHPRSLIFTLTFPLAFIQEDNLSDNILFYSPNIKFTYCVNKKLVKFLKKAKEKDAQKIFQITWKAVIDSIVEAQSIWVLENMHLVKYRLGGRQNILRAEYLGISKLQASLIIDDHIREYLNKSIPTPKKVKNKTIWVWLLEEFIKDKSLTPHIVNYIHGKILENWNDSEKNISKYTLITSLAVDAEIKKMKSRVYGERIFDTDFFSSYKNVVDNVKNTISTMYLGQKAMQNIMEKDDKTKMAISLLGYIKSRNKYGFVNLLLKYITGRTAQSTESKGLLVNYLFNNVLSNTTCWENYALSIVIGIIYGGD